MFNVPLFPNQATFNTLNNKSEGGRQREREKVKEKQKGTLRAAIILLFVFTFKTPYRPPTVSKEDKEKEKRNVMWQGTE